MPSSRSQRRRAFLPCGVLVGVMGRMYRWGVSRRDPDQQSLFAAPPRSEPEGVDVGSAARVPKAVRFGTSSWVYPGWKGQVYRRDYGSDRAFRQEALVEYTAWPWFRAVGVDSTFYGPPRASTVARWDAQLPADFRLVPKVWEQVTIPRFPRHARYGDKAGQLNPRFLDAELFVREVLPPLLPVMDRIGALLFQLQELPPRVLPHLDGIVARFARFFAALPTDLRYAVEVRNPELLTPAWFAMLRAHRVAHCFNAWNRMPSIGAQRALAEQGGGVVDDLRVLRLLTPAGLTYGESVDLFEPYDRLQAPQSETRQDAVEVLLDALAGGGESIVLVNNRLEGNSPATIEALGRMLLGRLDQIGG